MLWLGVVLGGFVLFEPAPYDLYMALVIPAWMLLGLKVPRAASPLVLLLIVFLSGGILASAQAIHLDVQPMYMAVTGFLALSACFYACVIADEPQRMHAIANAWVVAALATAVLGICGYFGVFGELFVRFGRATGGFQDPNVFGPFLVLPFLVLVRKAMRGSPAQLVLSGGLAMVVLIGIFLSFSRATWGVTVLSTALMGSADVRDGPEFEDAGPLPRGGGGGRG